MSAKIDFIEESIDRQLAAVPEGEEPNKGDEYVIAEWCRQLVLARLEEWQRQEWNKAEPERKAKRDELYKKMTERKL